MKSIIVIAVLISVSAAKPKDDGKVKVPPDGQYPYHVAIVSKGTKDFLCDGTIVDGHWIMTMNSCLNGKNPDGKDIEVIVGGVADLTSDLANKLTHSVINVWRNSSYDNEESVILLKVDKDLLTPVKDVKPQRVEFAEEGQMGKMIGSKMEATSYEGGSKLWHAKSEVEGAIMVPGKDGLSTISATNPFDPDHCLSTKGAPLVQEIRTGHLKNKRTYTIVGIGQECNPKIQTNEYLQVPKYISSMPGLKVYKG